MRLSLRAMTERARREYGQRLAARRTKPAQSVREAWMTLENRPFIQTLEHQLQKHLRIDPETVMLSELLSEELHALSEERGIPLTIRVIDDVAIAYRHATLERETSESENQAIEIMVAGAHRRAVRKLREMRRTSQKPPIVGVENQPFH